MENDQEKYVGKNPEEERASKPRYPSGYRFAPKDEELIIDYLWNKINDQPIPLDEITQVLLYQHNPQTLADTHPQLGEKEWYFFTPRDRKYQNGSRPSRSAGNGYWKATGSDRSITFEGKIVGFKKSLVFHEGRPPAGNKTNWIMHEYRANLPPREKTDPSDMRLDDWVLCRIYMKSERTNKKRKRNDDKEEEEQLVEEEEQLVEEEDQEEEEEQQQKVVAKNNKVNNNKVDNNNVDSAPVFDNATFDNTVTYQHQITGATAFNDSWTSTSYLPDNYDDIYIHDASHLVYYNQQPNYIQEPKFTYLPNQMTSFVNDMNPPYENHHGYHQDTSCPSFNHPYILEQSPDTQDQENLRQVSSSLPLNSGVFVEDPTLSSGAIFVEDPKIKFEDSSKEDADYN